MYASTAASHKTIPNDTLKNESDIKLKTFHAEKTEDDNISKIPNENAEVKAEPSSSDKKAHLEEINSIDMAIQSLINAKKEITNGDERRTLYEIQQALQNIHKFKYDRLSKSSEYWQVDPVERVKAVAAESNALMVKAQCHKEMDNYVEAINVFEEASIKIRDALELRYCDIGKELDWTQKRIANKIHVSKLSILSRMDRQRLRRRVKFDGTIFYGKSKIWRRYLQSLLTKDAMKSTYFLNLKYDLVAKWKHELDTETNNGAVFERKSIIVSIDNMNLLTSNESQNDSFMKTDFLIKMGCKECEGNTVIVRGKINAPPILISALRRRISEQLVILSSNEHVHWAIFKVDLNSLHALAKQDQTKSISIRI